MKKLADESKAAIVLIIWIISFYIASFANTPTMWVIFGFITILDVVIVYFDYKREQERKKADKNHKLFIKQCKNYTNYIKSQRK